MPVLAEQNTFVADFERAERELSAIGPTALHRLREAAIQRFAVLGFPTLNDEDWRFTPLAPLTQTSFKSALNRTTDRAVIERLEIPADGPRLVFVNGRFAPSQSSAQNLPAGIVVAGMSDALKSHRDKLEPHLAQYADYQDQAFTAMNTAFIQDGPFIFLPRNTVLERPISLIHVSAGSDEATVSYPRTLIVAEANTQAKIVEAFAGQGEEVYFTNAVTELVASEGANIEY